MADSNRPESGDPRSSRPDLQSDGPLEIDLSSVIVRRSDGDDCQILEQVIDPQTQDLLDLLYNYPRLIQRVEACYLSITIIDSQYRVIGMAIFEDFPQGLEGMYDYLHENSWEQWLPQAFNIREEFDIRPFNSLWLVYFYLDRKNFRIDATQEHELLRMVFQNVYATNPNIEGINFLLRGDVVDEVGTPEAVKSILNRLFIQIPVGDINALKKVRGIQPSSQMFYSPRQKCFEYVEIRIAKQEDHDDLAEIFNKQSEVLTTQFGEFFIAELIAFQNENQKALVAQVDDRAVGLMSISKDIDYKLLAEGFELEQYDNLLRAEFMEAVKDRKDDIQLQKHYEEVDRRREAERKILEEKMLTSHWGQRIALQQHLRAKETKIKDEMIGFTGNEELNKTLTREIVENMIDEWLTEFKLTQPGDIFYEQGVKDPEINCWVITERNFFLETLVYFGLPKDYLEGNGHWHDWAYVKLIERKQQLLRKAPKKQKQPVRRAGRARQEEKKDDDYNEPTFFDLMPLQRAFDKFMASGPDARTTLRNTILDNMKKFVLIFSDENGELLKGRNVDVTELGDYLKEAGINLPAAQWEYIPFILDCFGDLKFDKKITKVMPQDEKAKREELKDVKSKKLPAPLLALKDAKKGKEKEKAKDKEPEQPKEPLKDAPTKQPTKEEKESKEEFKADPKTGSPETKAAAAKEVDPGVEKLTAKVRPNDIVELFSAFEEILAAIEKVKAFDQMMMKLGVIKEDTVKDPTLKTEVKDLADKTVQDREDELRNRERNLPENPWRELASNLDDLNGLPGIPIDAHNAIAINLFCIDENYESRSIDFLEYAFNLFPDRDYIILTQPHIVNESILLQSFIQIPKKKNAIFDDVLYVFHKDALLAPLITVRRSTIEDLQEGQFLYAHMSQAAQIESDALESIKSLTSNKIAFTVLCQDTIIGFYILTKDVNLLYYKSHFAIQDFMVLNEHPRNGFSKILYAILNPVFSKYTRYILKELMRLANKTCMYFEIHKDTALPDIFSELILTRNRKFPHLLERKWNHERDPEYMEKFQDLKYIQDGERDPMDEKEASFSLAMITKKLLSVNKINDNTRIVVVGASDTGISLIESLLSVRYVNFPHITLLAPGGMRAIHAKTEYLQMKGYSTNYTLVELRNLLLDSRITVIDARMVNIDRKNKTIKLDKQAILPYDVLVLTLGLCDTQLQDMQLVSEGIGKLNEQYGLYPDRTFIKGVYSIDDPYLYDIFAVNKGRDSPITRLARRKRPEDIVLYGRSLHVYSFINGLINRGVKPERIKLVIPPKTFDRKKEFPSNQDRWDYEDLLVWDPPAFEEEAIEEKVHQILVKLGVQMYTNLKLHAFETDKDNHLQVAIFKKYGENGEPIEKKAKAPVEDEDEENEEDHEHLEGEEGGEDEDGEENGEGEEEEEESDEERIPVRMLVTSRTNDIDLSFFYAIHENGLVYNGRLIVKRNFQTTDPAIFAAGRLCEFSQRYKNQAIGTPLRLDKYSGREVGQKLSRAIMEHIGLLTPEVPEGGEEELPTFFMPMGVGGVLPNDLFYYYVRKIEWARPQLTIEAGKNREDIVCDNLQGLLKGHYIKFTFDHNGIIDSVTYLGSEKIVVQSLVAFVGLSEKYLNKLDTRFKDGLIENVAEFLSENWAIALYHEWFSIFRHKTKMEIANKPSIQEIFDKVIKKARKGHYLTKGRYDKLRAKVSLEVTKAIEDGTLDFIRENLNHLPMYYIPDEEFK